MLKKLFYFLVILSLLVISVPQKSSAAVLNWEPMVNSTFSSGVRSPGFGDTDNIFTVSMTTFDGSVYVSNYNIGNGTEIWRSSNGTDWAQVNEDGFGDPGEPAAGSSAAVLAVFDDNLYAVNFLAGQDHVHIYRYSSGTTWNSTATIGTAEAPMTDPYVAVTYDNKLYISLITNDGVNDKSAVYSSANGTNWTAVDNDGFGGDNEAIYAMGVYNNYLYAGTYNAAGAEIWRYDGTSWVIDNTAGFGSASNDVIGTLTSFGGALYASTDNNTTGTEVWKSSGGGVADWTKVSDAGFSQGTAAAASYGGIVFKNKLYIGTTGAKVFRSSDGNSWEQVNVNGFGYDDNLFAIFTVLGDYLYAGTGNLSNIDRGFVPGGLAAETTEIYRYYEATVLPETGTNSSLNTYILDALI